ncbi:MAG: NAD(P)-dependent oxidoreductase [Mycobacterium sp.]|jgi:NAD(P)H dehydrogenase (quinone)|nr:NAD(P)-dependent oxidoreductase [Mycobacterium sp.]
MATKTESDTERGLDGKVYDISGVAAVTMDEIADYISAALRGRVEYRARTQAQQRAVLQSAGLLELLVDIPLGLDALTRDNVYAVPSQTVFDLTGHPHARSKTR